MKVRAKDKDGENMYGQHICIGGVHFLWPDWAYDSFDEFQESEVLARDVLIQIDISTAAVATGKKDKNGVEIYGSMGDMKGGDRVCFRHKTWIVKWDRDSLRWVLEVCTGEVRYTLGSYDSEALEIIPQENE